MLKSQILQSASVLFHSVRFNPPAFQTPPNSAPVSVPPLQANRAVTWLCISAGYPPAGSIAPGYRSSERTGAVLPVDYPPSVHLVSGVVVHIHLHLSDVLVGEVAGFQINPHKAFQNVVAEHQINVKILSIHIILFS